MSKIKKFFITYHADINKTNEFNYRFFKLPENIKIITEAKCGCSDIQTATLKQPIFKKIILPDINLGEFLGNYTKDNENINKLLEQWQELDTYQNEDKETKFCELLKNLIVEIINYYNINYESRFKEVYKSYNFSEYVCDISFDKINCDFENNLPILSHYTIGIRELPLKTNYFSLFYKNFDSTEKEDSYVNTLKSKYENDILYQDILKKETDDFYNRIKEIYYGEKYQQQEQEQEGESCPFIIGENDDYILLKKYFLEKNIYLYIPFDEKDNYTIYLSDISDSANIKISKKINPTLKEELEYSKERIETLNNQTVEQLKNNLTGNNEKIKYKYDDYKKNFILLDELNINFTGNTLYELVHYLSGTYPLNEIVLYLSACHGFPSSILSKDKKDCKLINEKKHNINELIENYNAISDEICKISGKMLPKINNTITNEDIKFIKRILLSIANSKNDYSSIKDNINFVQLFLNYNPKAEPKKTSGGGYYQKYLKYKLKYLKLVKKRYN